MRIYVNRMHPNEILTTEAALQERWAWYFSLGVALMILGMIAIGAATFTTYVSVMICGALLLAGCLATIIYATQFWQQRGQFFLHVLVSILYGGIGAILVFNPVLGAISLTFALSLFYLVMGCSRIIIALTTRPLSGWGWMLVNGIIGLMIGVILLLNWPTISMWAIGLFVGIDLFFIGWWLALLGWSFYQRSTSTKKA